MNRPFVHRVLISLFGLCFLAHVNTYGIDTPMLEKTISIVVKQERIDAVLKKIAQQGGFTFSYNAALFDASKIVTFDFSDKTIREILDELFDGNVDYKERKNYLILTKAKKTPSSKQPRVVSGYVADKTTGKKLPNVTIYDPASLSSSITDAYGFFTIKIHRPTPDVILTVNKKDYLDTLVVVPNKRGLIKIKIKKKKEKIVMLVDSARIKWNRFFAKKFFLRKEITDSNVEDTLYRSVQVSVVPFVGTNHLLSSKVINDYSFNIYGGYSLGVRKFEIGGVFNIVKGNVTGTQLAGSFNAVAGKVKGVQMAGHINANRDSMNGAQLAGLVNLNWNSVKRFSAAGLLNITHRASQGVILAGLANVTLGEQKGLHAAGLLNISTNDSGPWQLAGLCNFTTGGIKGMQGAGALNFSRRNVNGVQIGGVANFAGRDMVGAQVCGVLNYATNVDGLQLGLINVSDSIAHGVPIGLLSFSVKGYHKFEIFADEVFYTNIAFRTGVRRFYNIFTAGIKPQNSKENYWTVGYGIGTAPRISKSFLLNIDITANQVSKGNFTEAINMINKACVGLEVQLKKNIGLAVGLTLNAYLTDRTYTKYANLFTDYNPDIVADNNYDNNINMKMWVGAKAGVRFF